MNPQDNNTATNLPADQPSVSLPPVDPATSTAPQPVVNPVIDDNPVSVDLPQPQPVATDPSPKPQTVTKVVSDGATPPIADDVDLIEKEWVEKAKQLVDQTKGDPYKQSNEVNKFKATYIKKRYNKDVQTNNE